MYQMCLNRTVNFGIKSIRHTCTGDTLTLCLLLSNSLLFVIRKLAADDDKADVNYIKDRFLIGI